MASSMAEDLECPVCLAIFREPHTLRCGHNFCLSCLQGCVHQGQEEGTCPECRHPFELRQLACNRALANLAEKAQKLKLDRELLPGGATAQSYCEDHDEPLKLFCRQDRVPICVICRDLPQHRGHEFLPTQNAAEYAQGKLKPYLKVLEKHLKGVVEDESYQKKEIAALEWFTEDNLSYISREFKALHQILNEKEQDIKKTVQEMKDKNWEEMKDSLSFIKEEVLSDTEIIDKIKAALEATDQVAFLKGFKDLVDIIEACQLKEVEDSDIREEEEEEERLDKDMSDEEESKTSAKEVAGNNGEACEYIEEVGDDSSDDEDYEEEEESDSDADRVMPVELAMEEFRASLDFEAWKKMLDCIKPSQVNWSALHSLDEP